MMMKVLSTKFICFDFHFKMYTLEPHYIASFEIRDQTVHATGFVENNFTQIEKSQNVLTFVHVGL